MLVNDEEAVGTVLEGEGATLKDTELDPTFFWTFLLVCGSWLIRLIFKSSDRGLKNVGVAEFLFAAREDSGAIPYITGRSSVHNQRIERLWRDVFGIALHPS